MLRSLLLKRSAGEFKPETFEGAYPTRRFEIWVARRFYSGRSIAVALAAVAISVGCHAQNNCPWLNVATASGALGAPTTLTLNKISDSSTICIFKSQSGSPAQSLSVSVTVVANSQNAEQGLKTSEKRCTSSATPLKAIGNDAVLCTDNAAASHGEQVIGRVRDQIFIISMTAEAAPSHDTANDAMTEKVKSIAEQVAGNLF